MSNLAPTPESVKTPLTCQFCGHTGEDVQQDHDYVGGQGYGWYTECCDLASCFKRQADAVKEKAMREAM